MSLWLDLLRGSLGPPPPPPRRYFSSRCWPAARGQGGRAWRRTRLDSDPGCAGRNAARHR